LADRDLRDLLALAYVDHLDGVPILGARVDDLPVRAELRVLRVLSLHLDGEDFLAARGVDKGHAVRLLSRGGDPASVGGAADAFGGNAERDRARLLALLQVDEHEPVSRLVADVEPASCGGRAARLAAGLQRGDDGV